MSKRSRKDVLTAVSAGADPTADHCADCKRSCCSLPNSSGVSDGEPHQHDLRIRARVNGWPAPQALSEATPSADSTSRHQRWHANLRASTPMTVEVQAGQR